MPRSGVGSPRPWHPGRLSTDPAPPSTGPTEARAPRTEVSGTPERGPGACAEHRCVESAKIRAKYPDRVPVIVEKVSGSQIVDIDKRKYLVPSDITVAQFMWIIRKRIQLPSEKAIFLFVDKTVPQSSLTMGQLYEKEKDEDGFLYVAYSGENTFGF
ncbi:GABA(A) receptor-associated protein-like 2 isoformX1 [Camelus ferus]|nr:GABA(A) receptor-associated protein-like 2 isoformX1 [Camelus ferus]